MKFFTKQTLIFSTLLMISLVIATVSSAAPAAYTLHGNAELIAGGHVSPTAAQLRSGSTSGYGYINFAVTEGLTFADYGTLSTDYFVTEGTCGAGSPRFQFQVVNPTTNSASTIEVYFMNVNINQICPTGSWQTSGDLTTSGYVENLPEAPNTYVSYETALSTYGAYEVTGIQLVVDSGYVSPSGQTFLFDNVKIGGSTYTFETANSCKQGGYSLFTSAPGPFTNQGQCVSYFAKGGQ